MLRRELVMWVLVMVCAVSVGGVRTADAQGENGSRARQVRAIPSAEVTIVLNEQFFNSFLDEVFTDLNAPSYKIAGASEALKKATKASAAHVSAAAQEECASVIVLEREMDGVRTSVHFENGRIVAPLAFRGTYGSTLLGCLKFQGWADTVMTLEFDAARQVLNARVNVENIHLSNVPKAANGLLVGMVQKVIDMRINPVELIQSAQLSARIPVAAAGGALRLRAREVRPEITKGALQLHIIYEFTRAE
ncbi:MAG TPA: hypothetical protein VGO91_10410 [Pyrinomonadaceae bacterium]|jgi:hypothetical protein|nr:hypothetical protein [Pyrinomonadaceae bacterium]